MQRRSAACISARQPRRPEAACTGCADTTRQPPRSAGGDMAVTAMAVEPAAPAPDHPSAAPAWPLWQRVGFRFFFVYLMLQVTPWDWFGAIPGVPFLLGYYQRLVDWAVRAGNDHVFHVRETLVPVNGSGDTSWAWTAMWLYLSIAAVACVVWSVVDRRRTQYDRLAYWFRTIIRY